MKELDTLHKRLLKLADKNHYSTSDWDFDNTDWELDTVNYVSSPSSWHRKAIYGSSGETEAFIKTSVVPISAVKQGRLVTQIRMSGVEIYSRLMFYLRYQDATNYYNVEIVHGATGRTWTVSRYKTGNDAVLRSVGSLTFPDVDTWKQMRITWWNDAVGLVIRCEKFENGAWSKVIDDCYDAQNNWKDIGGRVGFWFRGWNVGSAGNLDDTDIYGA